MTKSDFIHELFIGIEKEIVHRILIQNNNFPNSINNKNIISETKKYKNKVMKQILREWGESNYKKGLTHGFNTNAPHTGV